MEREWLRFPGEVSGHGIDRVSDEWWTWWDALEVDVLPLEWRREQDPEDRVGFPHDRACADGCLKGNGAGFGHGRLQQEGAMKASSGWGPG
jgi:hypothetical protein